MMEIPKAYEPQSVEDKWYQFWLDNSCFTADPARVSDKRPAYSIVIPPPNVTGMLHMGHVLNNTIQDILSRKARMDGKEVLWLPGTDHAGIATQVQVEKQLKKEERLTKYDLGREEFLKRVWAWKEKHGGIIINQLKKLGCSCDWTRERFTMDPEYSRCVQKVFVELYKKGLIYRGKRMVNWCPVSQTALSDEEVEMKPQKGFMYQFKVEVVDATPSSHGKVAATPLSPIGAKRDGGVATTSCDGGVAATWLTIATTRPETIPGDTAVAVNPKDPRYAHLIGKHIVRPLPAELPREQKLIPIIGDEHVDFEFGTGVLKVTPAHDKADFEIRKRWNMHLFAQNFPKHSNIPEIGIIEIIDERGTMNDLAGADLKGLDRFKARKVAEEKLTELGALVEAKPYENNVGFSQRADVPIEPRLSEQWFLKYPAVPESKACVAEGRMKFHPERWAKTYDHWLTNIQDWCISRQLWWGHRIPAWSIKFKGKDDPRLAKPLQEMLAEEWEGNEAWTRSLTGTASEETVFDTETPPPIEQGDWTLRAVTFSDLEAAKLKEFGFTQDPDVLDTWFSSWLWPFATMGWPEQTDTLKKFYPTTDLVTGPDIIFFWVARMIMAGYEYMGELPFKNVYFTGIVRDKKGDKMSKTKGNSPDPIVLIAQYGADALRFGTMRSAPLGQDVLFDEKDVELGRNFCNKLWNACRFRQMVGGSDASSLNQPKRDGGVAATSGDGGIAATYEVQGEINSSLLTTDDKWILLKLNEAIREISEALNSYNFSVAVQALYRFFWNEYCDWYVEASKAVFFGTDESRKANTLAVIDFVLSHTIRLFHPFLPFITEELWHGMGYATDMPDHQGGKTIMNAPWPKPFETDFRDAYSLDDCYLEFANDKYEVVTQGRNLRRVGNIQAGKKVKFVIKPSREILPHDSEVIKILLNAEAFEINADYAAKKGTPTAHTPFGELFLPLDGLIDVEAEKARLTKEVEKIQAEITKVEQKLANPAFTQKVPAAVLQEHEQRLVEWRTKLDHVKAALDALG
ncbi:MAG: valine--tRNA ligase [Verrucomicrobia bacterium]|nr:valine--tRNA ligase [Verrucomicrobiota bacterium]